MKDIFPQIKKIHFSGIGGIGVSAMAKLFLLLGKEVSGSDMHASEITEDLEKRGVNVTYKQVAENVTDDMDLLVYSPAVPESNLERAMALDLGVIQKSYPEMLGAISKVYKTVAVSGTNGKSSTTAMLSSLLIDTGVDPTVIFGSQYIKLDRNFRGGASDTFLVEACEYRAHMLLLTPRVIILTNIEEDHLDYFKDLSHIIATFQAYIDKLTKADDVLVLNADDQNSKQLHLPKCTIVTFSIHEPADVRARNVHVVSGKQTFDLEYKGELLGTFVLRTPGQFNVYNALAALAYALTLGLSPAKLQKSLEAYSGIWRRYEKIKDDDVVVISDYAHHPTAVRGTLRATKEFYPDQRIIAVFEPHQHDRTQKLFDGFVDALYLPDVIILPEIFEVQGRTEEQSHTISSKDLASAIKKQWPDKKVLYAKDAQQALDLVNFNLREHDVVVVMGAGTIYEICPLITLQK